MPLILSDVIFKNACVKNKEIEIYSYKSEGGSDLAFFLVLPPVK